MRKVKISVFLRSPMVAWEYKNNTSHDFWDDVYSGISEKVAPMVPEHEAQGTVQHHFFVLTDNETEYLQKITKQIVSDLLGEKSSHAIISVTEQKKDVPKMERIPEISVEKELVEKVPTPLATNKEEVAEEPKCLFEHAEFMKEFKASLLSRVRGQRHAVDQMVQGVFECEMFSKNNPKRKGPLATFLFTGPSGVGKTYLAEMCGELLGRKTLVVDMSEYSDNLANNKFNGEHGQPAVVTRFVRENPDGIIIFDEVEKAHINTIHLFLQILDAARLMDHQVKKEVSFRNNIIIMTTNAGKELYEDTTVCDLSAVPRNVILEALRKDVNPQTNEPFFPECITTRMANGRVILFNHLEPYALMEIIRDEIALQMDLFSKATGINVEYDHRMLSALVLYNGGGVSDARTLRGLARNIVVRELQEIIMQIYGSRAGKVSALKNVNIVISTDEDGEVGNLFALRDKMYAAVFSHTPIDGMEQIAREVNTDIELITESDMFKRRVRGVVDYMLIDPLCGIKESDKTPNDIEDIKSEGMQMFEYVREFFPETPVYILDSAPERNYSFDTLLARGAKGVIAYKNREKEVFSEAIKEISFNALINNSVFSLGRSGKFLAFNCAQYIIDETEAVVSVERLKLRSAPRASDGGIIAQKGENNNLKFADVVGCKGAKEILSDYCKALNNPREVALSGKKMPKGVLLYGPPGTGKTMLAKAMANESDATFIPVSATSFFGSLVGETERNIREIFRKARRYAPSVIFIDEVDAIARMRTGSSATSHNEDALNTFLAEMDGFVTDEKRPVFILAATNYSLDAEDERALDPAFVRRFDNKVLIPLPDTDDRYELLTKSLEKHGINFGEDHQEILRNMAERTGGMNNADLEMMNTRFARIIGEGEPDRNSYMNTLDEFRFGEVNKMDPEHLRQTACHEAGHALVCRLCGVTPSFLTIVSRGNFGGFMESAGENKAGTYTYNQLMDIVCRCLAGRIAEVEVYGAELGVNTGASSDVQKARSLVRASVNDYAMGEKFFIKKDDDEEAEKLMRAQYQRTCDMIRNNRDALDALTELLVKEKSLDKGQMDAFFAAFNI